MVRPLLAALQAKARLAAKLKKDDKKKSTSAVAAAEAKARKAKMNKQKDSSKFNQVGSCRECYLGRERHRGCNMPVGACLKGSQECQAATLGCVGCNPSIAALQACTSADAAQCQPGCSVHPVPHDAGAQALSRTAGAS